MDASGATLGELQLPPRPKFHHDVPLRTGIVMGLLLAGWFQLIYQSGYFRNANSGLVLMALNMLTVAGCLWFVGRSIRRRDAHYATFTRIFFYCLLTGIAAGFVLGLHDLLFNLHINPDYSRHLFEQQLIDIKAREKSLNPQVYQQLLEANRLAMERLRMEGNNPSLILLGSFKSVLFSCGIYGLLAAAIFRWPGSWVNK